MHPKQQIGQGEWRQKKRCPGLAEPVLVVIHNEAQVGRAGSPAW